jgi:hypothetical protein
MGTFVQNGHIVLAQNFLEPPGNFSTNVPFPLTFSPERRILLWRLEGILHIRTSGSDW